MIIKISLRYLCEQSKNLQNAYKKCLSWFNQPGQAYFLYYVKLLKSLIDKLFFIATQDWYLSSNTNNISKTLKIRTSDGGSYLRVLVELRGIEPLSENSSITASPITVFVLTFPRDNTQRQVLPLGSFMNFPASQSFDTGVSHWFDASNLSRGELSTDSCHQAAYANLLSAFIFNSKYLGGPGPPMASITSKSPSKPVQPLVYKDL